MTCHGQTDPSTEILVQGTSLDPPFEIGSPKQPHLCCHSVSAIGLDYHWTNIANCVTTKPGLLASMCAWSLHGSGGDSLDTQTHAKMWKITPSSLTIALLMEKVTKRRRLLRSPGTLKADSPKRSKTQDNPQTY